MFYSDFFSEEPDDPFVDLLNHYQAYVEYIKGSPLNDGDLEKARALNASACLVFANLRATDPDADDAATVLRVLSIKNFCPSIKVQVSVIKTSTLVRCHKCVTKTRVLKKSRATALKDFWSRFLLRSCNALQFSK